MAQLTWNIDKPAQRLPTKVYLYDKDYAVEVHDGDGDRPARPWLMTGVIEYDFPAAIVYALGERSPTPENLADAWDTVAKMFEEYITESMDDERWYWPRETLRSTGEVADSPRDIVDTGELRDSLLAYDE